MDSGLRIESRFFHVGKPAVPAVNDDAQAPNAGARAEVPHDHGGWIEGRLCVPGDNEETRHRKVQFTIASILVVPGRSPLGRPVLRVR